MDALIFTFLLYGVGLKAASSFHAVIYEYHAIDAQKTWYDAQRHCRTHYTDLATFQNMEDIERFQRPASFTGNAWIGLFDNRASWKGVMGNESNSWRWSSTGTTSPGGYQNWLSSEPDHHGATNFCGLIRDGLWGDGGCESQVPFVCFTESPDGSRNFTLVSAGKTWTDAQTHCRKYFTDLATIWNEAENSAVASVLVAKQWTWFGLYRRPWRWSDGSTSTFKRWSPGQPNNYYKSQHCVGESNAQDWNDLPCSKLLPFVCAKALKSETHQFRVRLWSDVDLSNPTFTLASIQKLATVLQERGLTDINVRWKSPPQRVQKEEEHEQRQCT